MKSQIAKLDENILSFWKERLNEVTKSTKKVSVEQLMKMLTLASEVVSKRNDIPRKFEGNLKTAADVSPLSRYYLCFKFLSCSLNGITTAMVVSCEGN